MFYVRDNIHIDAPIDRCFLLSTSVDLVAPILGMKPVSGRMTGLVVANDQLLWRGWKFGLPALHETLITRYDRPNFFQDTQGRGRFDFFQHDHHFTEVGGHTLMSDEVRFSMPFGALGRLIGKYILVPHVQGLLHRRFHMLKSIAEGPDWQRHLPS